jgi:hypothetical protein
MMTQAKARRVAEDLACAAAGAHLVEIIHRTSLSPACQRYQGHSAAHLLPLRTARRGADLRDRPS